ncbi:TPA: hypothetical protein SMF68_000328 [Serratia marcescens]|uniref:hypothetical protein n=1 Tax=Serratia TaxID=613 RepID=UPI0011C39487|nr:MULTISPECIES: hypothetical protein [Serratia]EMC1042087.1 hypothetical protein [Serratia marcescens]MDP8798089.1 hypothetical protein [Serratia marcescens]TXE64247.1 hypothetical protein FOT58_07765 [Serratia nematodiphila]HEJ7056359.1 hypothetical protein [Serratia marcescens]HEJ7166490.1 hypothetical protein [Serratia marcescens]
MSGKTFGNKSKNKFLRALPDTTIESCGLAKRCKFNFSFFDANQEVGQDFSDWTHDEILKLIDKMKHYTSETLEYWRNSRCGAGGLTIYENYKSFPARSDFIHPKHIPHDVEWARFRLENMVRLIGFVIPSNLHQKVDEKTGHCYDSNTFYVVFLDRAHRFYLSENA